MDEATSFPKAPRTREANPYPDGESMKAAPFDATPEFEHFKEVMRAVLVVPKSRLDKLVQIAKDNSPRNGNPHAPGQKPVRRKRKPSAI
jgi:hypothetical protein